MPPCLDGCGQIWIALHDLATIGYGLVHRLDLTANMSIKSVATRDLQMQVGSRNYFSTLLPKATRDSLDPDDIRNVCEHRHQSHECPCHCSRVARLPQHRSVDRQTEAWSAEDGCRKLHSDPGVMQAEEMLLTCCCDLAEPFIVLRPGHPSALLQQARSSSLPLWIAPNMPPTHCRLELKA